MSLSRTITGIAAFFAAMLTACSALAEGEGGVLYWMVDSNAQVSDGGVNKAIATFIANYSAETGSDFAARVRVTGGDLTEDTFLYLYDPDAAEFYQGDFGVTIDDDPDGAGYWGFGVPEGNMSSISAYSSGSPEYSFTVEIGNIAWDDNDYSGGTWTTIAVSATTAYKDLGDYIHATFDVTPSEGFAWTPTQFTAVPEPTGGLLAILGMALLALRRRRHATEV